MDKPNIMFTGFLREDEDGTYSCILTVAGIPSREIALKIGLSVGAPLERTLEKEFGKFQKIDTLRGHA